MDEQQYFLLDHQKGRRVLTQWHNQQGVTLIELIVGIAILAILLAVAAPNLSSWIQNAQIRTAAEAMQNGLQLARAEAVRRNASVRFQLMDTTSNACVLSTTGVNWIVSQDDPSGACASTPSDTVAPRIIQMRAGTEGSTNATVASTQSPIAFNGLGRQVSATNADLSTTANPPVTVTIDIKNPTGGLCMPAGTMRCLQVQVSASGQVRMCDPAIVSTDPRGC